MADRPPVIPPGQTLPPLLTEAERTRLAVVADDKPKRATGKRRGVVRRRFALLNAVADTALPRLKSRTDYAAWLLLYRFAKPDGTATASVADLARRAGCCESAMRRGLKRLQSAGLVERLKRGTLAGGPSVWRLLTPEGDRP